MQKLLIAAGKKTAERLESQKQKLEDVLETKYIDFCVDKEELQRYINDSDTLIYYSDFPEEKSTIDKLAEESRSINGVITLKYENQNKLWLYDGNIVANCIIPEEEIPAIKRAMVVPKYVNTISQWVAAIIIFFLVSGGLMYSHKYYMALREQNATIEQTHSADETIPRLD